jgi:hypothetical protein
MKLQHSPNKELGLDAIVAPHYKFYPKQRTNSGTVGAIRTYAATFYKLNLNTKTLKAKKENVIRD